MGVTKKNLYIQIRGVLGGIRNGGMDRGGNT